MKFKILTILLTICLIYELTSCSTGNTTIVGDKVMNYAQLKEYGFSTDELPVSINDVKYRLADLEAFFPKQRQGSFYFKGDGDMLTLNEIDVTFPVRHLRSGNCSMTYIVYPVEEGGFYLVFLNYLLGCTSDFKENKSQFVYGDSVYFSKLPNMESINRVFVGQSFEEFMELFPQTVTSYYLSSCDAMSYSPLSNHFVLICTFKKNDNCLQLEEWKITTYNNSSIGIREFDIWCIDETGAGME